MNILTKVHNRSTILHCRVSKEAGVDNLARLTVRFEISVKKIMCAVTVAQ